MTVLPALAAIPADIVTLADYERRAVHHMPAASWRHIQSGADREITLAANIAQFDALQLLPRVLADLSGGSTAIRLLGMDLAAPMLLAPLAYHRLAHPDGELAVARAAAALGTGMVVSTLSSFTLEEIALASRAASRELGRDPAPLWFQLYLQDDRERSAALVRRAEAAGYDAIVLTVDASLKRSGFTLPAGIAAANLRGLPSRSQTGIAGGPILFGTPLIDAAPTWDDLAWLRQATTLPLIVKGILAADDARLAIEHGADGIIVSNHGGRVMDGLPTPLSVLPGIAEAVGGRAAVLVDGGIRQGTDIAKALALGADAVLVGRPQLHALAVAGVIGVAHVLHILRAEYELAQAQLGCRTPAGISRAHVLDAQNGGKRLTC
ncbi:alpha-hydroxy-acid oxidizing enzyme [Polymorphobacter glacialis]|uniref:Alpha-hydroxy-acid oxidizing enzyme n=1 Tax=Sandarakinorhabdus glacialis TaxID=1614636 RepID=A0A917A0K4_9SPHN|nr:alpha-hydroxy acid oxidase [Polymorphobacter glacialis]GGE20114.1 alpha-hydroxy-acid oxidizing enzyme [Polymorphobacter glacialis]